MIVRQNSEVQDWKTTYRLLFALMTICSAFLCERFAFPILLKVSWQGTIIEEITFVFLLWFVSSLTIGTAILAITMLVVFRLTRNTPREGDGKLDRPAIATQFFSGSLSRWFMSLSPCVGPPLSLAILSNFYSAQLYFPSGLILLQACVVLGLVTFILCLPLTLDAQRSLNDRVKERFGVSVDESETNEVATDEAQEHDEHAPDTEERDAPENDKAEK